MNNNKLKMIILSSLLVTGALAETNSTIVKANDDMGADMLNNNDNIVHDINERSTPVINGIRVNKQLIDINYSKGQTISPKYIVIHDTDNRRAGADAMANRNYFANHPNANASAHYIVDDSNIVQVLEDTWKGWHIGDGGASASINNNNAIGIELAVNSDGNFSKTYETGIALTRYLMNKYNIPAQNIVMHKHASGKDCSRMMIIDNPNLWAQFKQRAAAGMPGEQYINDGITASAKGKLINVSSYLHVRQSASSSSASIGVIYPNAIVNIYGEENGYYKIDFMGTRKTYGYISKNYVQKISGDVGSNNNGSVGTNKIEINKDGVVANLGSVSALNIRSGPGTSYSVQDTLALNTKIRVNYEQNGWYNITYSNGKVGFASKTYVNLVEDANSGSGSTDANTQINKDGVVVNLGSVSALNVRKGPGTSYSIQDTLALNTKVKVNYKTKEGWYNISYSNGKTGFVSSEYIKLVEDSNSGSGSIDTNTQINKDGIVVNLGSVSALNVRKGPGTSYSIQDTLALNTKVKVNYKTKEGWYNISYSNGKTGFVSSEYIKLVEDSNSGSGSTDTNTQINKDGVVVNLGSVSALNVRKGPGTSYSIQDTLALNTKVKVNYKTKEGWYNISYSNGKTGFVSSEYIKLVEDSNSGSGSTNTNTQINKDGIVSNLGSVSALNVRKGPGTSYSIQDTLALNTKVKVNYKTEDGWYNITYSNNKVGFVSGIYIKLVENNTGSGNTGSDKVTINKNGTVTGVSSYLNVRSGPSTSYSMIDSIKGGKTVKVNYETNGWYNISYDGKIGYVSKSYITLSTGSSNSGSDNNSNSGSNGGNNIGSTMTGTVYNVSSTLNVRNGAGTNNSIIDTLRVNEKVTINYETNGWYNITYGSGKKGFVSKDYIKLDNQSQSKGKVVNVETNLNVRSGKGTNYSIIGYLLPNSEVIILEQSSGWYKIKFNANGGEKIGYVKDDYIKRI